jgi:hypothetical protein
MGRPPLDPEQARTERVVAHLRASDFAALTKWASARGVRIGELVREILERALRRRE